MQDLCCTSPAGIDQQVLTMAMLEAGSRGIIKNFIMNCEDSQSCRFVLRLKEIGLHAGAQFEVLKNTGSGELTISCEGSTLALGRGMADKINVEVSNGTVMSGSVISRFCKKLGIRCQP